MTHRYKWLDEDMGMCQAHPGMPLFFRLISTKRDMCVVCMKAYQDKKK